MANEDWSEKPIDQGQEAVDREIERLRRVYQNHSETLAALAASAPTKALSRKYRDLIGDINRSIVGLDDPGAIVSRSTAERPIEPPASRRDTRPSVPAPQVTERTSDSSPDISWRTAPGVYQATGPTQESALGRIVLILGMAIIVICLLAFFVWKYGGDSRADTAPPGEAVAAPTPTKVADDGTGEAARPAPAISASPEAQDYGVVYSGTRVAKSFEVFNNTDRDVPIEIERSTCRCLWFEYPKVIPAGGRIELSVAVDGGRAQKGLLSEAVVISTKEQPRVATEVEITAEIR